MEADDALTRPLEEARLDETAAASVDPTRSFSTDQQIDSLFDLLRLPPELAAVAQCVDDAPACIGRYPVVKLLGSGGFGRVVLAYDERLNRNVAIKTAHMADNSLLADAQRAAQLRHDGIVTIHAVETTPDGSFFVVMEYLEGGSLAERLKREGKLPPDQAVRLVTEVALAVQHAHQQGLFHRDLKPENILFDADGRPHVVDFGLAVHESQQVDRAGEVSGTWLYMAPEQVRGEVPRIDGRTDVWRGVILYELLTGKHPFTGRNCAELTDQINHRDPRPPRQIDPAIPVPVQAVVLKCLSKQPADRYASAADLADALRRSVGNSRPWPRLLALAIGLAAVAFAVAMLRPAEPKRRDGNIDIPLRIDTVIDQLLFVGAGTQPHHQHYGPVLSEHYRLREGDGVQIRAKLTTPAYCFLLAFRPDGEEELCFPADPDTPPPLTDEPSHPLPDQSDKEVYGLTDGVGLQAFLLVASAKPLPTYRQWRQSLGSSPWKPSPSTPVREIDHHNGQREWRFALDMTGRRGKGEHLQGTQSELSKLVAWLRRANQGGNVVIDAWMLPVLPRDEP